MPGEVKQTEKKNFTGASVLSIKAEMKHECGSEPVDVIVLPVTHLKAVIYEMSSMQY